MANRSAAARKRTRAGSGSSSSQQTAGPVQRAAAAWATFTLAQDTQRSILRVPHVLTNWMVIVAVGLGWWARWDTWWRPLAAITVAALLYSMGRAARHIPAHTKTVQRLYDRTAKPCGHPRSTARTATDPSQYVIVKRWNAPKTPATGVIAYTAESQAGSAATRWQAERAVEDVVATEKQDVVVDWDASPGYLTFTMVPVDDERVQQKKTRRWIESTLTQLFKPKRGSSDNFLVTCTWASGGGDEPVDAPTVEVDFGAQDVSARDKIERGFDGQVQRSGVEWIYDWDTPGTLTITPTGTDTSDAIRKRLRRKIADIIVGAVGRAVNRTAAGQTTVDVTRWTPEDHPQPDTPIQVDVMLGTADVADPARQQAFENTVDVALENEWTDRVWLAEWQFGQSTGVQLSAVPVTHQLARRKAETKRLREVAQDIFRGGRTSATVEVSVDQWRTASRDDSGEEYEKPVDLTLRFGTVKVDSNVQLAAETRLDGLYSESGWSYNWDTPAGSVRLREVRALPPYAWFPEPGTEEFSRLEQLARQGVIVFGPIKGGGEATIDFNSTPHTLVGGNTGSGKSVLLTIMLFWAAYLPDVYELVVCDPKRTDFTWTAEFPNVRFAGAIPEIQEAVSYAFTEMQRRQDVLNRFQVKDIGYLHHLAEQGEVPPEEVPRRLILFFDEMSSFFSESKNEEVKVLQGEARNHVEQIVQLGRAPWVNVFGAAQKPSNENLGTLIRELMNNKIGIGWMKKNMSEQVLGSNLATVLSRNDTPKGRGWCLVEGQEDAMLQTFYIPHRTETVDWADGAPTRPGVLEMVRDKLTESGWQSVQVPETVTWTKAAGEQVEDVVLRSQWVRGDRVDDGSDNTNGTGGNEPDLGS